MVRPPTASASVHSSPTFIHCSPSVWWSNSIRFLWSITCYSGHWVVGDTTSKYCRVQRVSKYPRAEKYQIGLRFNSNTYLKGSNFFRTLPEYSDNHFIQKGLYEMAAPFQNKGGVLIDFGSVALVTTWHAPRSFAGWNRGSAFD